MSLAILFAYRIAKFMAIKVEWQPTTVKGEAVSMTTASESREECIFTLNKRTLEQPLYLWLFLYDGEIIALAV